MVSQDNSTSTSSSVSKTTCVKQQKCKRSISQRAWQGAESEPERAEPVPLREMQYLLQPEAEDSLLEASLELDRSSLLGFLRSSHLESSEDVRTVACVVLIDQDEDDMSLRERTVTDVSTTDGNAADLVCGRLLSLSSDSSPSLCQGRDLSPAPPLEKQDTPLSERRSCCRCVIV